MEYFRDRCCNPLGISPHFVTKSLRSISAYSCQKYNLKSNLMVVCAVCRKRLQNEPPTNSDIIQENNDTDMIGYDDTHDVDVNQREEVLNIEPDSQGSCEDVSLSQTSSVSGRSLGSKLPVINQALELLDQSQKTTLKIESWINEKVHIVSVNLQKSLEIANVNAAFDINDQNDARYFDELMVALKEKYRSVEGNRALKLQILTLLPAEWSDRRIAESMDTTRHMAKTARILLDTNGILSQPEPKRGKSLSEIVKNSVIDYYNDERNCVTMPGKKDYVSSRDGNGNQIHTQNKLILSNLTELFQSFKLEHSDKKVGFSTFATLRPKHCTLAGASGTHTVCVCSIHQNIKLMILGSSLKQITANCTQSIESYHDGIKFIVCDESTEDCYLGKCTKCPKIDLKVYILTTCSVSARLIR